MTWSCCWASCVAQTHTVSLCVLKNFTKCCFLWGFISLLCTQSVSAVVHPHTNFSPTLFPLVHMIFMEVQLGRKVLFAERCLCSLSCCLLCSSALRTFDTNQRETGWFRSYLRMLGGRFHWKHSRSWSYLDHSCATLVLNYCLLIMSWSSLLCCWCWLKQRIDVLLEHFIFPQNTLLH